MILGEGVRKNRLPPFSLNSRTTASYSINKKSKKYTRKGAGVFFSASHARCLIKTAHVSAWLPMFWQQICCRIKLIEPHSRSHKPCTYKELRTSVDEQTNLKWQQRSCNSIGRFRDFVSAIERFRAKARKSGTERFAPCHSLRNKHQVNRGTSTALFQGFCFGC